VGWGEGPRLKKRGRNGRKLKGTVTPDYIGLRGVWMGSKTVIGTGTADDLKNFRVLIDLNFSKRYYITQAEF